MAASTAAALAAVRLAESGLTAAQAKGFGIEAVKREDVAKLSPSFNASAALKLNYFTPSGRATGFYRLRYLEHANGFDALTTKPQRYVQPPKTPPEVYWPKGPDWPRLASDPTQPVHLTEGELKACCAVAHGFPTLAIGGVWSWRSAKRGEAIVPSLTPAGFEWAERTVYVTFDSDVLLNPDVAAARLALCDALTQLGARPALVALPSVEGLKKTGFDDFILAKGADAYLTAVIAAEPFASARALWELNSEVVYVKSPGLVVVLEDERRLAPHAFVTHAFANRHFVEQVIKPDGSTKLVKRSLAKSWVEWEGRSELERLTYAPGEPRVTSANEYNAWRGWGCHPKKGDVGPWKDLLDFLFRSEPAARRWFERWCAAPLQKPGLKMYAACVMWGIAQGTGKSFVGYALMKIYGVNATEINDQHLVSNFNEWAENRQFVMGDDVTSNEHRQKTTLGERLKTMITQPTVRINTKFVPSYTVPDRINYYFTSQHPDAFFLEDSDRRYFVHEVAGPPAPKKFYDRLDAWLKGDGPAALFHHLLHLDLGDFDGHAHAPTTKAKTLMIDDSKSDLGTWVARLKHEPDSILKLGDAPLTGDLFTTGELLGLYDPERKGRVTANGLGRELKRGGVGRVNGGLPVMTARGAQRLYAIRNAERWAIAQPADAAQHYASRFLPVEAPKKKGKF